MGRTKQNGTAVEEDEAVRRIDIPQVKWETIHVGIRGTTPLVTNAGKGLQKQHTDKVTGAVVEPRGPRNLKADCEDCIYLQDGKPAVLGVWFKKAMTARITRDNAKRWKVTREAFKLGVRVSPERPVIEGERGPDDEQLVRVGKMGEKQPDVRRRPKWPEWSVSIDIHFRPDVISVDRLLQVLMEAGLAGIGEGRPQKGSELGWGTFEIETVEQPTGRRAKPVLR